MIESFSDREAAKIFRGEVSRKLPRDIQGQWSIRINKQWRICFVWNAEKIIVTAVEITDYR